MLKEGATMYKSYTPTISGNVHVLLATDEVYSSYVSKLTPEERSIVFEHKYRASEGRDKALRDFYDGSDSHELKMIMAHTCPYEAPTLLYVLQSSDYRDLYAFAPLVTKSVLYKDIEVGGKVLPYHVHLLNDFRNSPEKYLGDIEKTFEYRTQKTSALYYLLSQSPLTLEDAQGWYEVALELVEQHPKLEFDIHRVLMVTALQHEGELYSLYSSPGTHAIPFGSKRLCYTATSLAELIRCSSSWAKGMPDSWIAEALKD